MQNKQMIEFCKSIAGGIEMITARNFLKGKLVTLIWGVFLAGACKQIIFVKLVLTTITHAYVEKYKPVLRSDFRRFQGCGY